MPILSAKSEALITRAQARRAVQRGTRTGSDRDFTRPQIWPARAASASSAACINSWRKMV